MCKVYTDVGGIKYVFHDCPSVREIIHELKLVAYLHLHVLTEHGITRITYFTAHAYSLHAHLRLNTICLA